MIKTGIDVKNIENWAGPNFADYKRGYRIGQEMFNAKNGLAFLEDRLYYLSLGPETKAYPYHLGFVDGWGDEERRQA